MLLLVLPHGHPIGIIQQDIGRHQNWVGKEPV